MAKYILLAFDSDADADAYTADVQRTGVVFKNTDVELENLPFEEVPVVVRGMWKKPTKFCSCIGGGKQSHGFVRGTKYGWWVCARCHKPTEAWSRGDVWYTALGTNLLPIAEDAPEYRGPLHKKHPGYEEGTK
jgi:hypothetical protein